MDTTIIVSDVLRELEKCKISDLDFSRSGYRSVFDFLYGQFVYDSFIFFFRRKGRIFLDQLHHIVCFCFGIYQEHVSDDGWR